MIFCAPGTRGLRRVGRVARPSSCSRNAHDKNVLVRRAQSRIDPAPLKTKWGIRKMRAVEDQSVSIPGEITSKPGGNMYIIRCTCMITRREPTCLQHWERGIEEEERRPTIPYARATRGLRRPSLDTRTLGNRQAISQILGEEDERSICQTVSHGHGPADDENSECPRFLVPPRRSAVYL